MSRLPTTTLLAAALLAAPAARASALDEQFDAHAADVVAALQKRGVRAAGVLPFRLERPGTRPGHAAGPACAAAAEKLEAALILHAGPDEATALGVVRAAGRHPAARGWSASDAGRRKLFTAGDYPLAWGKAKVAADAFLTGTLRVAADLERTDVTVTAVLASDPDAPVTVAEFAVANDRAVLADLGLTFSLDARAGSAADLDRAARASARVRSRGAADAVAAAGGVRVTVLYAGEPQAPRPLPGSGEFQIDTPPAGAAVVVALENTADEDCGVVVRLNGQNVIQKDGAADTAKYVLKPGTRREVKGFLRDDGVVPFRVVADADLKPDAAELGERLGWFDFEVFRSGEPAQAPAADGTEVSMRGLRPAAYAKARGSLKALQAAVLADSGLKRGRVRSREVITAGGEPTAGGPATVVAFPNPTAVGHLEIAYRPAEQ